MRYTALGPTGLQISRLALGTAVFGVAPLEADADKLVGRAMDLGINVFDSANSYGNQPRFDRAGAPPADQRNAAEVILGKALGARRNEVILCSKVMEPVGPGVNDRGLSRTHICLQIEQTLRRLKTDHVDVYYAHHPDPKTPIEQTIRTFDDLIHQGKIRYWALSTFPAWQQMEALWVADRLGLNAPVCNQVRYTLLNRAVEAEIVPAALRYRLSLTVFSPLQGGLLGGVDVLERPVIGSARWGFPAFGARQLDLGRQFDATARRHGHDPAQLALAWLFSRPAVSCAIMGPETVAELEASAAAADLELSSEVLQELEAFGQPTPEL